MKMYLINYFKQIYISTGFYLIKLYTYICIYSYMRAIIFIYAYFVENLGIVVTYNLYIFKHRIV